MEPVTFNNIPVSQLPVQWQAELHALPDATVTVHIETESNTPPLAAQALDNDPAFGIWRDRVDLDVPHYVQQLRGTRYQG
jgi:hypothetical protein